MNDCYALRESVSDEGQLARFYRFMKPSGLVVGGRVAPNWMLDGASFWYAHGAPYHTVILRVDAATGQADPLFDAAKVRAALAETVGHELPSTGLPFDAVSELGDGRYLFSFEGSHYILATDHYRIEAAGKERATTAFMEASPDVRAVAPGDAGTPRFYRRSLWTTAAPMLAAEVPSPDRRWFASVAGGNIMLRAPIDDRIVPLTTDGTEDFTWDVESPRFKVTAGLEVEQHALDPWAPDGARLFAIKIDRRALPDLPLVHYLKRDEEYCPVKIARAGGRMGIAHPHVIDILAKRARRFDLGDTEDQFFVLLGWLPNGSEVLFTRHSRDFKVVDVLAGNPGDGAIRTILSESSRTFVALQHDVIYSGDNHATVLPDGTGLIWRSSRSGWNHLYLYALDGRLIRPLTQGDFPVIDVVAVDQDGGWVYFTAHHDQDRPYDTHLCRVRLTDDDAPQRLTMQDGANVVSVSPTRKTFTVVNSRTDRPWRTDLYTCNGKHIATIQQADASALDALGHVVAEEFTVTAADGQTTLWGVMYRPADFDPAKRYPIVDHLYGGPQVAMVPHHFGLGEHSQARLDRALAQLGYIVISVDARGTPERSKAFQDVVYRNWGRHEIPDHVCALRQLAQRHAFIDLERVGVWGHSWGGYFTIRALAQAPDFFHVGVASAPGIDPYDLTLYEPYLDLPTRAKEAYDYASNYEWAGRITGKLMLVAGTSDPLCFSNTIEMAHYLIRAGVEHELVILPGAGHSFLGRNDEYFVRKLVGQFEVHLKRRYSQTTSGDPMSSDGA